MQVRVRYMFALRDRDSEDQQVVEVPAATTVFEVLRTLGLADLELLTALNGASVSDSTALKDGDELVLIPAIQGG
ncbi:MAG: MoaD/ThiS family protein [Dehalococcoidia bacterium]|nr:MoaD/ThiS family protein [Dehalococcoidia bacterium]MCA9846079.1 MoaD/ThiS family protein [Dehalococcoidia bacterium]